ncbi:uncharacterized protein [Asterias amurensis]|uniref:uncharacterized protein n=1 Tax=Asterias amurensis TaxID=7602 RepID=UPI003AB35672
MAEELQRILECPMCLELYDSSNRWPKLLPCQHTFCRTCLGQLDKHGSIACPQCRQQHKSPVGGSQQLPNNFTMLALLDVHKKSGPSPPASVLSSSEATPARSNTDSVRKAIAELARRLQQKAGELSSFDTKQKTIDEKFLAVKSQVDGAFESRSRDLQIRKEAVIKQLAGMRQEELNLVETQKASANQYLQKFQREFASMRESILTSQQPTQEQYNQLLTVCQRYTQQIEQYALTIDERLCEVTFTDPNRTQLAVSINSYGVLQVTGMDKTKQTDSNILHLQSPSLNSSPAVTSPGAPTSSGTPALSRNSSSTNISVANLSQHLPNVKSAPNLSQQEDGTPSSSCASSRAGSPSCANRNQSQIVPNTVNQVPSTTSGHQDGTGSVFALSGSPSVSESRSVPVGGQTEAVPNSRNPFLSDATSRPRMTQGNSSQNSPVLTTTSQRKTSLPSPIPSSNLPLSRSPAAGDATRSLAKHTSLDKPAPPGVKPSLPSKPLSSYTRHASIDFTGRQSPASGDSNSPLSRIKEQSSRGNRPASINFDTTSSTQSAAMVSPEGVVPPLPPRRVKNIEGMRSRSMSTDAGMASKKDWAKFDTIGSRSRKFGKGTTKDIAIIGSGWFGGSFFEKPTGVAILPNNLMAVVDERNHCVSVVTDAGQLFKTFGSQGNGPGQLQFPKSICLNSRQQIIVSDWWNHRIQIWDINGQFVSQFGTRGSQASQLDGPMGVTCDSSDNIFVCDTNHRCIKVFSPAGQYLRQIGKEGSAEGSFVCPSHLVISPGGELLITDSGKHCVHMFSTQGTFLYQFGEWGTSPGQLNCPSGIMIDPSGYLFVSSSGNHRVETYNPSGSFASSLGTHGAEKGQFDEPVGIASTSDGQVVICDSGNKRLQIMLCYQDNQSFV